MGACLGASLLILCSGLLVLWLFVGFIRLPSDVAGGLGQRAGDALHRTGVALAAAAQVLQDARDPLHPPRYSLTQDPEFDDFLVITTASGLPSSSTSSFSMTGVHRRTDATGADAAVYAQIHRQYLVPKVTRALGIVIRTDKGEQEYALYRGQMYGIAHRYYKVNWLSLEENKMAVVRLKRASEVPGIQVFDEE